MPGKHGQPAGQAADRAARAAARAAAQGTPRPADRPARAAWQAAPGRPQGSPRALSPPKVGLKGLGEVPAGDSRTGGAALRAFSRACEDPLQPPYGAGLPGRFVGQTLGRLRPTTGHAFRLVDGPKSPMLDYCQPALEAVNSPP